MSILYNRVTLLKIILLKIEVHMNNKVIAGILVSQYKAALYMFRQAIEKVPADEWNTNEYKNPHWQIAYHTIWTTKFYLGPNPESLMPWPGSIAGAEHLGGKEEWENPEPGVVVAGYQSKEEIISFIENTEAILNQSVEALPFEEYTGFDWYPYTRFEFHINNIRHIQHHAGQIIERLKAKGFSGFHWAADGTTPKK